MGSITDYLKAHETKRRIRMFQQEYALKNLRRHWDADLSFVSFPKCGRTWLRVMMGKALNLHFDDASIPPLALGAWHDTHPEVPRVHVTHEDAPHAKAPLWLRRKKRRFRRKDVLFLVRDPRDVLVSQFFQATKRQKIFDGDLEAFVDHPIGSWNTIIEYYNIWADNHRVPRRFLLARYEDLHTEPVRELRRVMCFMGLDVGANALKEAVEFAAFDNLRAMEKNDEFSSRRLRPGDASDPESFKTRKGQVGGYTEYLSEATQERLTRELDQRLHPMFGYGGAESR